MAAKLVKDRKVVAMVGSSSFVECGVNAKMYAQEDVMVIAGVGVPRECFFAKNYVPVNTGPRVSATVVAMYAAQTYKAKKMVCVIPNIPSLGNWACDGVEGLGQGERRGRRRDHHRPGLARRHLDDAAGGRRRSPTRSS